MSRAYEYHSGLAKQMQDYIAEKRALGRKYDKESKIFHELDRFLLENNLQTAELPQNLVEKWISKRPNEKRKNQRYRLNFIKRFSMHMIKNGLPAYYPSFKITTRDDNDFVPYIFTDEEISKLLDHFDSMEPSRNYPNGHLVFPLLFRTLICCGLRVSEATNLIVSDVNLEEGVLLIREAKNDKKRYVPLSQSLWHEYLCYYKTIHPHSEPSAYFFPNARNNAHCTNSVYVRFREALWHVGIQHQGRGRGPRVHDLRHTFSVRCMQKFERNNKDITVSLPYLSMYLGHYDMSKTQNYLRLISEVYPEVIEKQCAYLGDIMPTWEDHRK